MKCFSKKFLLSLPLLFSMVSAMEDSVQDQNSNPDIEYQKNNNSKVSVFRKELLKTIDDYNTKNTQTILNASLGKDIVVAIGNTGAGKSTFLNLLIDKKIIPTSKGYELSKDDLGKSDCFSIGTGGGSQTLFPKIKQKGNLLFVDLPGLSDNRGDALAFFNAVFIKDMITKAKTVRFLFVEGQDSFGKRATAFKETIRVISGILGNYDILKDSSILVVPKVDFDKVKVESFIGFLKDKLVSEKDGDSFFATLKNIFKLESTNPNLFTMENASNFFERRTQIYDEKSSDEVMIKLKDAVMDRIYNLSPAKIEKINPRVLLNNDVESALSELMGKLMEESIPELKLSKQSIKDKKYLDLKELEIKLDDYSIKTLDNIVVCTEEGKLIKEYDKERYDDNLKIIWDNSLSNKISLLKNSVKSAFSELQSKGLKLYELKEKSLKIKSSYISVSDINLDIKDKEINEILVFSSDNFLIDQDIKAPSTNFFIVANKIDIIGKRKINLRGSDGAIKDQAKSGEKGCASDYAKSYEPYKAKSGYDGEPGFPGENGGNFYVYSHLDSNLNNLTVDVSGGDGGKGQDGGDGANGLDASSNAGKYNVENIKDHCVVCRKKIGAETLGDYSEKTVKFLLTFNDKFEEVYESGGGQLGGDAGKGGKGGFGGNAGIVVCQGRITGQPNKIQNNGEMGLDGESGKGGEGGKNDEIYRGVYINEYVGPAVRGIKEIDESSTQGVVTGIIGTTVGGMVGETSKQVLSEGYKVATKKGVQTIVNTATKEAIKQGAEVIVTEGGKEVVSGVLKSAATEGGSVVVTIGGVTTIGSFLKGAGMGLLVQGVISPISAYFSSSWKEEPKKIKDKEESGYAKSGLQKNLALNEKNIKKPINQQNLGKKFDEYKKEFLEKI